MDEKQKCLQNTVKAFPRVWEAFELLDSIWVKELEDYHYLAQQPPIPLLLFFNAHAKIRLAAELAFSRCVTEAWALMRNAVESVALGVYLHENPQIPQQWQANRGGLARLKAFKREFEKMRQQGLYAAKTGLHDLHRYWKRFSESGAHATFGTLATRVTATSTGDAAEIKFNYLEMPRNALWATLVDILCCCYRMEQALFNELRARLELDPHLTKRRAEMTKILSEVVSDLNDSVGANYLKRNSLVI